MSTDIIQLIKMYANYKTIHQHKLPSILGSIYFQCYTYILVNASFKRYLNDTLASSHSYKKHTFFIQSSDTTQVK